MHHHDSQVRVTLDIGATDFENVTSRLRTDIGIGSHPWGTPLHCAGAGAVWNEPLQAVSSNPAGSILPNDHRRRGESPPPQ